MLEQHGGRNRFAPVAVVATSAVAIVVILSLATASFLPKQYSAVGAIGGVVLVAVGLIGAISFLF